MKKNVVVVILTAILSIMIIVVLGVVIYNKVFNTEAIFKRGVDVVYDNASKLLSNQIIPEYDYEKDIVNVQSNFTYEPSEDIKTLMGVNDLENLKLTIDATTDYANQNSLAKISYQENNSSLLDLALQMDTQAMYIDLQDIFSQILMTKLPDDYQVTYNEMIESMQTSKDYNKDMLELLDITRGIVKDQIDKKYITKEGVAVTINNVNYNVTKNKYTLEGEDLYNTFLQIFNSMNENDRINEILTKHNLGTMQDLITSLESSKNDITQNKLIISLYGQGGLTPVGIELNINDDLTIQYLNIKDNYYFKYETPSTNENFVLEGLKNSDNQINLTYSLNEEDMATITYQENAQNKKIGIESMDKKSNIQIEYNKENENQEIKIAGLLEEVDLGTLTITVAPSKVDSLTSEIDTSNAIDIESLTEEQQLEIQLNLMEKLQDSKLLMAINNLSTTLDSGL